MMVLSKPSNMPSVDTARNAVYECLDLLGRLVSQILQHHIDSLEVCGTGVEARPELKFGRLGLGILDEVLNNDA